MRKLWLALLPAVITAFQLFGAATAQGFFRIR
jgi:hypothetical protein